MHAERLQTEKVIFRNVIYVYIRVYTYMHITTINEEGGHGFGGEKGGRKGSMH